MYIQFTRRVGGCFTARREKLVCQRVFLFWEISFFFWLFFFVLAVLDSIGGPSLIIVEILAED